MTNPVHFFPLWQISRLSKSLTSPLEKTTIKFIIFAFSHFICEHHQPINMCMLHLQCHNVPLQHNPVSTLIESRKNNADQATLFIITGQSFWLKTKQGFSGVSVKHLLPPMYFPGLIQLAVSVSSWRKSCCKHWNNRHYRLCSQWDTVAQVFYYEPNWIENSGYIREENKVSIHTDVQVLTKYSRSWVQRL